MSDAEALDRILAFAAEAREEALALLRCGRERGSILDLLFLGTTFLGVSADGDRANMRAVVHLACRDPRRAYGLADMVGEGSGRAFSTNRADITLDSPINSSPQACARALLAEAIRRRSPLLAGGRHLIVAALAGDVGGLRAECARRRPTPDEAETAMLAAIFAGQTMALGWLIESFIPRDMHRCERLAERYAKLANSEALENTEGEIAALGMLLERAGTDSDGPPAPSGNPSADRPSASAGLAGGKAPAA